MAENNFEQILDEAMADELMELIQRRRSWPLTNRQQPQPSASGPQIGIGLANGARENGHNEMATILEELAKAKIDHVFEQFLADKSKSDSQRNAERRAGRRLEAYRTEMCKRFKKTGQCQYGDQCLFAHTEEELRLRNLHPNHKTKLCRNFSRTGSCRYGHHCQFIHRTPPNSPQENFLPLAQSAFNFNGGGIGMNGPLFVPQYPLVPFTSNPQYGSAFAFHQFGAQYTVINPPTPAYVDHNGFGIPNGLFAASTPAGNTHFPFPPPEEYLRR